MKLTKLDVITNFNYINPEATGLSPIFKKGEKNFFKETSILVNLENVETIEKEETGFKKEVIVKVVDDKSKKEVEKTELIPFMVFLLKFTSGRELVVEYSGFSKQLDK